MTTKTARLAALFVALLLSGEAVALDGRTIAANTMPPDRITNLGAYSLLCNPSAGAASAMGCTDPVVSGLLTAAGAFSNCIGCATGNSGAANAAAIATAITGGVPLVLGPGYFTTSTSFASLNYRTFSPWGGQLIDGAGNYHAPYMVHITSQPANNCVLDGINVAFNCDLSHVLAPEEIYWSGSSTNGVPVGGSGAYPNTNYYFQYNNIPHLIYGTNASGHNEPVNSNAGRTGMHLFVLKVDQAPGGQGDLGGILCNGFNNSYRALQSDHLDSTNFLAEPQVNCIGGQMLANHDGQFLQFLGDMNLTDRGFDVAGAVITSNLSRTNATGGKNVFWAAQRFQSTGTKPVDAVTSASGKWMAMLDASAATMADQSLTSINMASGGTGYTVGDELCAPDGTTVDQITCIKVLSAPSGVINTVQDVGWAITHRGMYGGAVPVSPSSFSGGTGTGVSMTVSYGKGALIAGKADQRIYLNGASHSAGSTAGAAFPSTSVFGTTWLEYSSSLSALNFIVGNTSVLQIYNNQVITTAGIPLQATGAANHVRIVGSAASGLPAITLTGTDTDISGAYDAKGTGSIFIGNGGGQNFEVSNGGAGVVNRVAVQGNAVGLAPTLKSTGPDTDISINFAPKGAGKLNFTAHMAVTDAKDIQFGTTTGTKFGTATNQKIGFFNATPVVQESGSNDMLASLVTLGLRAASSNPPLDLGTGLFKSGTATHTSASSLALAVGPNGATNPVLQVDGSTVGQQSGLKIVGGATGGLTSLSLIGTDADISGNLTAKGAGGWNFVNGNGSSFQVLDGGASVVNRIAAQGAATGNSAILKTTGSDTDISLAVTLKGAGVFNMNSQMAMVDGKNLAVGSTSGTKFGTATTQKMAFWNATPIAQPASSSSVETLLSDLGLRAAGPATFTGSMKATNLLISATAPTISSGFGTSPSVPTNNGPAAFTVNVGSGGAANSGIIGLPAATNGWTCRVTDLSTMSSTVFVTKQTASSTTSATIGNFDNTGAAAAWAASDILSVSCLAY